MHYTRGSQPVVRVPLVVRTQGLGGTQKHSQTKNLRYNGESLTKITHYFRLF